MSLYDRFDEWFLKVAVWREKHIKEKNLILFLSLIIGILDAIAAMVFKYLILFLQTNLSRNF